MRSLAIVLLIAALAVPSAEAAAQLRIGARGGLNRADVEAETGQRSDHSKNGLLFAAYLEGGLTGRLGYQVGPQYSQKGIRSVLVDPSIPEPLELELRVSYLELPILAMYLVRAIRPMALVVYAGGAPSLEIQCESTASVGNQSIEAKCGEVDEATGFAVEAVKSFDVTGLLGGGFVVEVGSAQVSAEAFYGFGLIPFIEEDPEDAEAQPDLKHRVTSFTLGVSFPLGGGPPSLLDVP
jgi:hypothetical protein